MEAERGEPLASFFQELYQLGQDFVQMVRQRQARRLDLWLARAHKSSSGELRGFASGIKRDYAAVKAALSLPWNQGQVEGQITRLKLLKRIDVRAGSL